MLLGVLERLGRVAVVQVPHESSRRSRTPRPRAARPTSRGGGRRAGCRPPGSRRCSGTTTVGAGWFVGCGRVLFDDAHDRASGRLRPFRGSDVVVGVDGGLLVLVALPDRERRRAEQAHDQRHAVPEQPDADRLAGGHAERVEQQHEQALPDAEPRERDRQHLRHRDRGQEREHRAVRHRDAERVDRAVDGGDHRDLVGDRGDEHAAAPGAARGGCGRRRCAPPR